MDLGTLPTLPPVAVIAFDAVTAGKVLGILTVVFAVLQALKKAFPSISGWWAVAINVGLSLVGVSLTISPDSFFTLPTLTTLLVTGITAAGAAGLHGTVSSVAPEAIKKVVGVS